MPETSGIDAGGTASKTGVRGGIVDDAAFWLAAAFILFYALGVDHLRGSEDRWAEIAREMLLTGDWFHPAINGEIYFDKPLLSYWFIAGLGKLFGFLDEFVVRLPSALSAVVALWSLRRLGALLFSRDNGVLSGWLLLSSYGFVMMARTGMADLMNLAAVVLAVHWFFHCKDKAGFQHYLLFYLICFAGASTKGLAAVAVPLALVASYVLMAGELRRHLTAGHFFAALLGLGLFLLPFFIAAHTPLPAGFTSPDVELSGLELVWRENITRFFNPWDHNKEPFYAYFKHLPRIMAPWSLLLFAASFAVAAKWKTLPLRTRWLLVGNALVFAMFSLSGSRRWYYILPIAPFTAMLMAEYVTGEAAYYGRRALLAVHTWLAAAIGVVGVLAPVILRIGLGLGLVKAPFDIAKLPAAALYAFPVASLLVVLVMFGRRFAPGLVSLAPGKWMPVVLSSAIFLAAGLSVMVPELGTLRNGKPFSAQLRRLLEGDRDGIVAFYDKMVPQIVFDARLQPLRPVLESPAEVVEYVGRSPGTVYLVALDGEKAAVELSGVLSDPEPFLISGEEVWDKHGDDRIGCWRIEPER